MQNRKRLGTWAGIAAVFAIYVPAAAASPLDWDLSPYSLSVGDLNFTLAGDANGAAFVSSEPSFPGLEKDGATGAVRLFPSLERDFDNGMVVALHASILPYRDRLAIDRYEGEAFEKIYLSLQTGLGTAEIGDVDGPGYRLAITGPRVDEKTSIDDPEIAFFRDPVSGRPFDSFFTVRTESAASFNDAKFAYYSPRLFGVQLAFSFAPSESRYIVPFVSAGPHIADRQANIWEFAGNYDGSLGPVSIGAYGALSFGRDARKTPGHEGLTDWAVGTAIAYPFNDDWKVSLGGSFRESNAYAFDINDVLARGATRAVHGSSSLSYGAWSVGAELTDGKADGTFGRPSLRVRGYEAQLAYALNSNLLLTVGWQQLHYSRSKGMFYSGPQFEGDAEFLHLDFHV